MRGTSLALAASMMIVLVTAPTGSAFHEDIPDYPNKFAWSAPADFSGDLLVEVVVDYGEENACVVYSGAAGHFDGGAKLLKISMSDRGGWSALSSGGSVAHAHLGPVDTRDITDGADGSWAGRSWSWGEGFRGSETRTFAAFGTEAVTIGNETWGAFEIEISCRDPFEIRALGGSTSVIGFTQASLRGGAGAGAYPFLAPEATVNVQDGDALALDTEEAVFAVRGFQILGASAGEVTLHSPGATGVYLITTATPDIDYRGMGGDYAFSMNRGGAALADAFWGILGGIDRVDHLDEIVD